VSSAVQAMREGAADYLVKPVNFDELLVVLEKVFALRDLARQTRQLRDRVRDRTQPSNIIGNAPPMQRVFEIVDQVATSKVSVLIAGESGTGKELVANAIHERSPRANGPFIKLHCAALAEQLLESELFGHEHGAFAGATARKDGRFSLADGGTLFLDEIGEISPAIQVKLLRVLQDRTFERVGGTETIAVDVRVISATNRNLQDEVARGTFREDLYYRLNVVSLEMPSLRERRVDIPALVRFFIDRHARANGKVIEGCTPEALELLMNHGWPGNVRELENAIERAVALCAESQIGPKHLPAHIKPAVAATGMPAVPGATLAEVERYVVLETLKATGGSTSRAAEMLGISTRTVQYRLHEYSGAQRSSVDAVRQTIPPPDSGGDSKLD
jgi:two-component system NtrC family response regulator/two-component system response regulator HydG